MRQWKLSPMDLESITRWEDYSRAKDEMLVHTDIPEAPWYVVEADDKRRARINMIHHLLSTIDYFTTLRPPLELPHRPEPKGYERPPRELSHYIPDYASELIAAKAGVTSKKKTTSDPSRPSGDGSGRAAGSG